MSPSHTHDRPNTRIISRSNSSWSNTSHGWSIGVGIGAAHQAARLVEQLATALDGCRELILRHLSPRTNGRANAPGWRTRLAKTAIARIVTTAGAMARKAGSMAS